MTLNERPRYRALSRGLWAPPGALAVLCVIVAVVFPRSLAAVIMAAGSAALFTTVVLYEMLRRSDPPRWGMVTALGFNLGATAFLVYLLLDWITEVRLS